MALEVTSREYPNRTPDITMKLPQGIQDMGEGCELLAWYFLDADYTVVAICGAFMNHDLLGHAGILPKEDLVQEFRAFLQGEQEVLQELAPVVQRRIRGDA